MRPILESKIFEVGPYSWRLTTLSLLEIWHRAMPLRNSVAN